MVHDSPRAPAARPAPRSCDMRKPMTGIGATSLSLLAGLSVVPVLLFATEAAAQVSPAPREVVFHGTEDQPPDQTPAPPPVATEPGSATPAAPDAAYDPAASEPVANTDVSSGPPQEEEAFPEDPNEEDGESSGYVHKEDAPYVDVLGAWGWRKGAYLVTATPLNMYMHDDGDTLGFHARFLALGVLGFEQRSIAPDGSEESRKWKTTFVFELIDPGLRVYFAPSVFFAFTVNLGAAFYDGLVPTLGVQSGFGFEYGGWGLEAGVRTSRLPHEATVVNGETFFQDSYSFPVYLAIETNLHL